MEELLKSAIYTIGLLNSCIKCGETLYGAEEEDIKLLLEALKRELDNCESEK